MARTATKAATKVGPWTVPGEPNRARQGNRDRIIKQAHADGFSERELGDVFGLVHSRIHAILHAGPRPEARAQRRDEAGKYTTPGATDPHRTVHITHTE